MIKKFLAKLINSWDRMPDASKQKAKNREEAELAKERHDQVMADRERKYVSERTVPTEGEILGPSEPESKEKK